MTPPEALSRYGRRPERKRNYFALGMMAIIALWVIFPTYAVRYRLTVEVETPHGLKTGSSVIEAGYGWQFTAFGLTHSVSSSLVGEAVFVDLGEGRNLVVTLTNTAAGPRRSLGGRQVSAGEGGPMEALLVPYLVYGFNSHHKIETPLGIWRARWEGPKAFDPARLPTTVTFPDINDPASVQLVDPTDLEATFGPGYRVSRAVADITNAWLTCKIGDELPWLDDVWRNRRQLSGSTGAGGASAPISDKLGAGEFRFRGVAQELFLLVLAAVVWPTSR